LFFSISQEPDRRFPNHYQLHHAWFNCDAGWQQHNNIFYKGYADSATMLTVISDFDQAGNYPGNYAAVKFSKEKVIVRHSRNRSFELWHNDACVTNLPGCINMKNIWASHEVHVLSNWTQTLHKVDTDCSVMTGALTWNQACDQILDILDQTVKDFFVNNSAQMKLYFSGGVDTLLLYSLLLQHRQPFELITYTHYEQDDFVGPNQENLNFFWNYQQIHHWREPAWLATGSHGDEYLMRGPEVIAMLTSWHDINFEQVIESCADDYHARYFAKHAQLWQDHWQNRHSFQDRFPTLQQLHAHVINFLLNDYQYLHLGNTLTWTPFKNINLARILLQCDIHELIPQFTNAQLTKQLIARTDPKLLEFLSRFKNWNSTENVSALEKYNQINKLARTN
jgi:hypothetical protein